MYIAAAFYREDATSTLGLSMSRAAVPSSPASGTDAPAATTDGAHFDENGVDLTLVRYTLSLTPTERLKAVENFMNVMASVRPASASVC